MVAKRSPSSGLDQSDTLELRQCAFNSCAIMSLIKLGIVERAPELQREERAHAMDSIELDFVERTRALLDSYFVEDLSTWSVEQGRQCDDSTSICEAV